MKRRLFILPILAGFVLSGCSFQDLMFWKKKSEDSQQKEEKHSEDSEQVVNPEVVSVTVSSPSGTVYDSSEDFTLTATVTVKGNASNEVTWSSSNSSVATVDATGKVSPKGAGQVTITATSKFDTTKSGSTTFTILEAGSHPELISSGYTFTRAWPTTALNTFLGAETISLNAPEGLYYQQFEKVEETEDTSGSAARFSIVFDYTSANQSALESAITTAQYFYFYDENFELDCFIDGNQKFEVDVYGTYLDTAQTQSVLFLNFYRVEDIWDDSTNTEDTAWNTTVAKALADLGIDLPFVKLGKEYDYDLTDNDDEIMIADSCADYTKLESYGATLVAAGWTYDSTEEIFWKHLDAYTDAVVYYYFGGNGNTIVVGLSLRELDDFPSTEVNAFVSAIPSKYSVPAFAEEDTHKFTFKATEINVGDEEDEDVRNAVIVGIKNVTEAQCEAYVGTLVSNGFAMDTNASYDKYFGYSRAYLTKGKIVVVAEIEYDSRKANDEEIAAFLAIDEDDLALMSEEEQSVYYMNALYYAFTGTFPVFDYDVVVGATITIYGDVEGIEDPGLYIRPQSLKLQVEATYQINPIFFEIDNTHTVSYVSANPAVATVSNSGLVTGVSVGQTTVTASIADTEYSAVLSLTIVEKISIAESNAALNTWLHAQGATGTLSLPESEDATGYESYYDDEYGCYSIVVSVDCDEEDAAFNYAAAMSAAGFAIEDLTDEGYGYCCETAETSIQVWTWEDDSFNIDVYYNDPDVIDFSAAGYDNAEKVDEVELGNGSTITFARGSGSNDPTYYDTGAGVRVYGNNTITVEAPDGEKLETVVFEMSQYNKNLTASCGTLETETVSGTTYLTWTAPTGGATSVTFTAASGSGHNRISSMQVILAN